MMLIMGDETCPLSSKKIAPHSYSAAPIQIRHSAVVLLQSSFIPKLAGLYRIRRQVPIRNRMPAATSSHLAPELLPLSAVVITHNHADQLSTCLASLRQLTDDLVVVDSLSTDQTEAVCQAYGARYFRRPWPGYAEQKNFGNAQAHHAWILSLDDDEVLSPELAQVLREQFCPDPTADAYDLPFRTHFANQPIRFGGWNPEWHIRLFDKRRISWNTDAVHEGLTLRPEHRVERLRGGFIYHFTVNSLAQLRAKTERYSSLFAENKFRGGQSASPLKRWGSPAFRFITDYVLKGGFLDGRAGWFIAWESARYTYLKYRKLHERYVAAERSGRGSR